MITSERTAPIQDSSSSSTSTSITPSSSDNSTSTSGSTSTSITASASTSTSATPPSTTLRSRSKSIPSSEESSIASSESSPRPAPLDFNNQSRSSHNSSPSHLSHSHSHSSSHSHSHSHSSSLPTPTSLLTMLLSPRSSNYERLEGGHGPARIPKRRFSWQKFAIAAVVLIGLVYVFGPRRHVARIPWGNDSATPYEDDIESDPDFPIEPIHSPPNDIKIPPSDTKPNHPTPPSTPINTEQPLTFATDPDRSSTPYCTKPHPSKSILVQWSLMIDAGSTGSRIHIYKFNNCHARPSYEYEVFVKNQIGLSTFSGRPLEAAKSLDELMDEATRVVPKHMWSCTPVYVKATAGLRLLGVDEARGILESVERRLRGVYPFEVPGEGAVEIMDGKDEGVYAWITANYLLGTIGGGEKSSSSSSNGNSNGNGNGNGKDKSTSDTYAVLDLGGASTQIVFKPEFGDTKSDKGLEEGEHKYDLKFGGETHVLYQHSYLGYGLMQARKHTHALVEFMDSIRPGAGGDKKKEGEKKKEGDKGKEGDKKKRVANPCLAQGTEREVVYTFEEDSENEEKVMMYGGDVGSFEACERVMGLVLAKDAICEMKPCSFNGVYQPSLLDTFKHGNVLLLSYFYDRIEPLINTTSFTMPPNSPLRAILASASSSASSKDISKSNSNSNSKSSNSDSNPSLSLPISTLPTLASHLCLGRRGWDTIGWSSSPSLLSELIDRPEWCLDMTFMYALLRMGYEFDDEREVRVGKGVGGTELGWCLGAAIVGLDGGVRCRV